MVIAKCFFSFLVFKIRVANFDVGSTKFCYYRYKIWNQAETQVIKVIQVLPGSGPSQ